MASKVTGEWQYQKQDDSMIRLADLQTLKEDTFLEEYRCQLREFEDILENFNNDTSNIELTAVRLEFSPSERTTMLQLVNTDNKILNKVIIVLSSLCWEMECLCKEAEQKFFSPVLFYGEGESSVGFEEYETQLFIGRMMPFFQDLSVFIDRCFDVTKNVLQQLASLYQNKRHGRKVINVGTIHFQTVYEHLGRLMTVLITLDEIIAQQSTLKEHWSSYKRMIKVVTRNPEKFGTSDENLQALEKLVFDLEEQLFEGKIFQHCVQQNFDDDFISVSKSGTFAEEFAFNIRSIFAKIENRLGDCCETDPILVAVINLYVLHFHIFRSPDKRFFKQLWDTYKKVPAVTLIGNILFFPEKFLSANLPFLKNVVDKKVIAPVVNQRQFYLQSRTQSLPKEVQNLYLKLLSWMIRIETTVHQITNSLDELTACSNLLIQGVNLAYSISHLLKLTTSLHVSMKYPMTKTTVLALCRLVEMLKAIQDTYHRHSFFISLTVNNIFQHYSFQVLSSIATAKKRLTPSDGKYNEQKLDVLSALLIAENVLNGPGTKERRVIAYVSMCLGTQLKCFRDDELFNFYSLMRKMDSICFLNSRLQEATDCSFLYWHRVILPIYWSELFEKPSFAGKSQYMAAAVQDCITPLYSTKHFSSPEILVSIIADEMLAEFEKNVLEPLCQKIETDLRLSIHIHLQLDDRNPFVVGFKDFLSLLRSRPIKLTEKLVNIKSFVEHYLAATFYNLTTVALHDWKTYEEMQNLAKQKFSLKSIDAHLPSQTLEQGLDVLEIMRNIHVFVSKYLYNLNNQIFVERTSNNKHLNTINIRHIANSIRTHGIGIMNTTVNFTYQFLRKKFYIFSQFMYDEHIKSRLIKDLRFFKENKLQTDQCYPFERAEKFTKGIRKLGLTPDGLSYLDQFRVLISQIGNAMGYVRMIRSGGLHCCGNAIRFIPDLEDIVNFEEICKEEGLLTDSSVAAANLDTVISNLSKNFTDSTEYFKLLVDVFAHVFKESKNMHLRNFYVIVPPLTLSFIEHSILSKERMSKKNKIGSAFTDDGFAMGIAYILRLLDQYQEFDSLHWFQSVHKKFRFEQEQVKKQREQATGKDDEKLLQTTTLTIKRLDMFLQEFDLLYYSLRSARIFFSADSKTMEKFTNDD